MTASSRKAGQLILALDQGTTSSRAIVFDRSGKAVSSAQQEFPQIFPGPGHVEHNAEDIWSTQLATAKEAIALAESGRLNTSGAAAGSGLRARSRWMRSRRGPPSCRLGRQSSRTVAADAAIHTLTDMT